MGNGEQGTASGWFGALRDQVESLCEAEMIAGRQQDGVGAEAVFIGERRDDLGAAGHVLRAEGLHACEEDQDGGATGALGELGVVREDEADTVTADAGVGNGGALGPLTTEAELLLTEGEGRLNVSGGKDWSDVGKLQWAMAG